jgi:hypothetical protein
MLNHRYGRKGGAAHSAGKRNIKGKRYYRVLTDDGAPLQSFGGWPLLRVGKGWCTIEESTRVKESMKPEIGGGEP